MASTSDKLSPQAASPSAIRQLTAYRLVQAESKHEPNNSNYLHSEQLHQPDIPSATSTPNPHPPPTKPLPLPPLLRPTSVAARQLLYLHLKQKNLENKLGELEATLSAQRCKPVLSNVPLSVYPSIVAKRAKTVHFESLPAFASTVPQRAITLPIRISSRAASLSSTACPSTSRLFSLKSRSDLAAKTRSTSLSAGSSVGPPSTPTPKPTYTTHSPSPPAFSPYRVTSLTLSSDPVPEHLKAVLRDKEETALALARVELAIELRWLRGRIGGGHAREVCEYCKEEVRRARKDMQRERERG